MTPVLIQNFYSGAGAGRIIVYMIAASKRAGKLIYIAISVRCRIWSIRESRGRIAACYIRCKSRHLSGKIITYIS